MARFEAGNSYSTGRKKGSKNRYSNDVRAAFYNAYDEMRKNTINPDTGNPTQATRLSWYGQRRTRQSSTGSLPR